MQERASSGGGGAGRGGEVREMSARARPARHAAFAHNLQAISHSHPGRHEDTEQPRGAQAGKINN